MQNKELYFKEVYAQSKDKVYRLCLGFVGNKMDADDLYQEVLIKIWQNLSFFRNESSIQTWIYRIATNTALLYVKKRNKTDQKISDLNSDLLIEDKTENTEVSNIKITKLYQAISTLKEMDRIIISLVLEQNSYQEISEVTGLQVSNVGARINRIKKSLTQKMKK